MSKFEQIKTIVVEHLGVEAEKVTLDAHLINDLGADSLDQVELAMACEEAFKIEVPDDCLETIHTVRDIVTLVERLAP